MLIAAALYARRATTLAARGRGVPLWRQICFASGLLIIALALITPLSDLADELVIAHMIEHLAIGDIATLLIVLGLTGPLLQPILAIKFFDRLRILCHPVVAMAIWAFFMFFWHAPPLYDAAYGTSVIHFIEQASSPQWALRASAFEFTEPGVLAAFQRAHDAGADVKITYHAKADSTGNSNRAALADHPLSSEMLIERRNGAWRVGEDEFRLGETDGVLHLLRFPPTIEQRGHAAGLHDPHVAEDPARRVAHRDSDGVALADAARDKPLGDAVG